MNYNYIVGKISPLSKDLLSLRIRAKTAADIFDFAPGQYAAISFEKNDHRSPMRCFSFANSSLEKGILEFGIKTGGDYTNSLLKLTSGDKIEVMGPYGSFVSGTSYTDELVFFAGGIGITPFLSVIRTAKAQGWPQKITLLYSVRTAADAAYTEELFTDQNSNKNFKLFVFLTKEDATPYNHPAVLSGQISAERISQVLKNDLSDKKFFICGPPPFMAAMRTNLLKKMVPAANIKTEEFSTAGNQDKSNPNATENKINKTVFALVFALLIVIAIVDSSQYSSKINAAAQTQNTATGTNSVLDTGSSNSSSTTTPSSSSTLSNTTPTQTNVNSSTNNSTGSSTTQNQYTPPRTRVS